MSEERELSAEEQALEADSLVSIKGEITDLSKRFWNEGWGFGRLKPFAAQGETGKEPVRITGLLEGFQIGQIVSVVGKYHSGKYGRELRIETIVVDNPNDMKGIRQWLIDRIPQIGPKRAEEVARRFGQEIWETLENNPYALTEVPGITEGRVDEILRAWQEHKKEREKYVPFYDIGLTHREAKAADKAEVTLEEISGDPFVLYLRISISFARNDILAARTNAARTAPSRLVAAAVQVIKDAAFDGHTAVDAEYVVEHASALASVPWNSAALGLRLALEQNFLCVSSFGDMIMLPRFHTAETGIAAKILKLMNTEAAHGRDHSGSDPREGGADDAHREGGDRDGRTGDGEEHDPA